MKRTATILLALAALALAVPCGVRAAEKKICAFDRAFIPFSFVRNQQPTGFEVEILEAALKGSGLGLEFKPMRSWEQGQAELASGVVHIAPGITRTDLRDKLFIYPSTPTVELGLKFFVNRASLVRSVDQLRGQTVATRRDSVTQGLLQAFGGVKVRLYDDDEKAILAVQAGDAQAYLGADKLAWDIIARRDLRNLVVVGPAMHREQLYFALYKGETGLRDLVDRGLKRIMADGEYDRIYRKWFVPEPSTQDMADLAAKAAAELPTAYAPRTGTPRAAAVLTRSGEVYAAASVEGPREGIGVTALEGAVARAVGAGDLELRMAVVVDAQGRALPPSGPERDLLAGFGRGVLVVLEPNPGEREAWMVQALLPFAQSAPVRPED
jgi:cytidine deaminase